MKKKIIIFQLLLFPFSAFSQCVEIDLLSQLFKYSLEKQDQILESIGFLIDENRGKELGMDWVNIKTDQYISIRRNNGNKVDRVQYRLKGNFNCYEEIKSKLSTLGFKKEFETIGTYSTFYFFYKSDSFGVILAKWKAPNDYARNFYQVSVLSLESYYKELEERK
jgi:hypothetical protein